MTSRRSIQKLFRWTHAPLWVVLGVCSIAPPISAEKSLRDRICNHPRDIGFTPPPPVSKKAPSSMDDPNDPNPPFSEPPSFTQRIASLNKAIAIAPNDLEAYDERSKLYTNQKMYSLANADYERIRQLEPTNKIRLLKNKAHLYSHSRQWEKLIQIYNKLLVMQPENARFIHLTKAEAYSELKNWNNAIAEYNQLIALSKKPQPYPRDEPLESMFISLESLYISRAKIYALQGKNKETIADYTSAIKISDKFLQSDVYRERCKNYVTFGDLPNARADAQVANELDDQLLSSSTSNQPIIQPKTFIPLPKVNASPYITPPRQRQQTAKKPRTLKELIGAGTSILTQAQKNDAYKYSNAIELFTQAIALDRNYAPAYYSRGLAHIKQNNLKLGIADFSEAIRLNPEFSLAYSARASAHQENGETDQALKDFDLALKTDPTLASANLGRGLILLKQQQWKHAAESFSKILESDPEMLEALEGRSIVRKNLNDLAGSLTDQTRAKRIRDR